MIPIRTADGTFRREVEEAELMHNRGHFDLIYTRRGHLKLAVLKERQLPLVSLSRTGTAFEQTLPGGHTVWALRGAAGSEADGA